MRDETPSRTAQWVAAARGLGRLLPEAARLADDPYGVAFSSRRLARWLDTPRARPLAHVPGLEPWVVYMQVRTKLIDDAVRAFVAEGGRQLVLLGAGFDCRALRMPELASASVYEVDHPATQSHKRTTLERLSVASPARYVTWDFETRAMDELPDALAEAGHDRARPTLTIWEGVTMYLSAAALDASLRAIAAWSAPGSVLAMTYFARSREHKRSLVTRAMQAAVAGLGEPWRGGWYPDELPGYLAERGFQLVEDVAASDAAHRLMPIALARSVTRFDSHVAFAAIMESIAFARR